MTEQDNLFFGKTTVKGGNTLMRKSERQDEIINLLIQQRKVTAVELVEKFGVSIETIRRDLDAIEKTGFLKKVYGGAILASAHMKATDFLAWNERRSDNQAEKTRIAARAAQFIRDDAILAMDNGTTMLEVALRLETQKDLTIITNDLLVGQELAQKNGNNVYIMGGILTGTEYRTGGDFAAHFLDNFSYIDIFLMTADGIGVANGITSAKSDSNSIKKKLMQKANKTIVLADSSKIHQRALFKTCELQEADLIITDSNISKSVLAEIKQLGVKIDVV